MGGSVYVSLMLVGSVMGVWEFGGRVCGTGPTDSRGGTPGSRPLETELAVLCRMYVSNFILPVCPQAACKLLLVTSVLLLYVVGVLFNVFEMLVPFPLCARGKACRFL